MSSDCEDELAELREEVDALRDELEAAKNEARKAYSMAIDAKTETEELRDSDDRLRSGQEKLRATVRNLQEEVAQQSSDIESWAARLIDDMVAEIESSNRQKAVRDVSDALLVLNHEPDRTTIYDVFEKADALVDSDVVTHATNSQHRLRLDGAAGELPETVGLHTIGEQSELCGGSTTNEGREGGRNTHGTDQPVTTKIGTD